MPDKPYILAGLAVFLILITAPFWYNRAAGTSSKGPELPRPANAAACLAPTAYMRTSHMKLLIEWREQVVRRDVRAWTGADGKVWEASLTGTCLNCHNQKEQFCDRCHNYASVTPSCWDCHLDPKLIRKGVLNASR